MPVIDKAQFGLKKETTYGTRLAADRFFEFQSEGITFEQRFHISRQLGSGAMAPRGSRRKAVTKSAGGPISLEVPTKGFGALLELMHDNAVTPVQQAATTAYLQTHNIGLTAPTKSATIQFNRPDASNTDRVFEYTGCMLTEASFSIETDGVLMCSTSWDAQNETTSQTLATRTLPTGLESFTFLEGVMQIGGVTVADVTDCSLTIPFARNSDFYPLNSTGLKSKPVQNDLTAPTGTATCRFADLTAYNRYVNGTQTTLSLTFTTTTLAGAGHPFLFAITCNQVGYTGETPTIDGPDVLTHALPFEVYYDGTNAPVIITYKSTDTTVP